MIKHWVKEYNQIRLHNAKNHHPLVPDVVSTDVEVKKCTTVRVKSRRKDMFENVVRNAFNNYYFGSRYLLEVGLAITNGCNLRCIYCEFGKREENLEQLDIDIVHRLMDEMDQLGVRTLTLIGGEPLVHTQFFDILTYAASKNFRVELVTNGTLIKVKANESLKLFKKVIKSVTISLDAANSEVNDCSRGKGTFNEAIGGLEFLSELDIPAGILSVVTNMNYREIPELVELGAKYRLKFVFFQPVSNHSTIPHLNRLEEKDLLLIKQEELAYLENSVREGILLSRALRTPTNLPALSKWIAPYFRYATNPSGFFFDSIIKNFKCIVPFFYIVILYNGDVMPCCLLPRVANIKDCSLKEAWLEKVEYIREALRRGEYPPECKGCYNQFENNLLFSTLTSPYNNMHLLKTVLPYSVNSFLNRYRR